MALDERRLPSDISLFFQVAIGEEPGPGEDPPARMFPGAVIRVWDFRFREPSSFSGLCELLHLLSVAFIAASL